MKSYAELEMELERLERLGRVHRALAAEAKILLDESPQANRGRDAILKALDDFDREMWGRAEVVRVEEERDQARDSSAKYYVKARVYGAIACEFRKTLQVLADRGEALAEAALAWRHSVKGGVPMSAVEAVDSLLNAEKDRDEARALVRSALRSPELVEWPDDTPYARFKEAVARWDSEESEK